MMRLLLSTIFLLIVTPVSSRLGAKLGDVAGSLFCDLFGSLLGSGGLFSSSDSGNENSSTALNDQFLVEFDDTIPDDEIAQKAQAIARQMGGTVRWTFQHVLKGAVIANVPEVTAAQQRLVLDEHVTISPDRGVRIDEISSPRVQEQAPSGLDRIDQSGLPLDNRFRYMYDGSGVTIYILDTGIRASHEEFADRPMPRCAFSAFDFHLDGTTMAFDCTDNYGHGSHVAATAAGTKFGVAKKATVVAMKVLDDSGGGSFGGIAAGIEAVVAEKMQNPDQPMVINLSLGGPKNSLLDKAVNSAIDAGVVMVVAAGNQGAFACNTSPGGVDNAITVGASEAGFLWFREKRALYSNWGCCVDIFAPGTGIASAGCKRDDESTVKTGTSMSSPFVAGAAALYLQRDPSMTPAQVHDALLRDASWGKLMWLFQWFSPNKLLNTAKIN